MWQNGFSIDDGELREYTDPSSQRFLDSLTKGKIPDELLRSARGGEVHVDMEDRRTEDYKAPPKPKVKAFSGSGNRLGSVVPEIATGTTATSAVDVPTSASISKPPAEVKLEIDETQPTTTIQIRLADGSRLVTKANHSNTIAQIRNFIERSRPNLANTNYILLTMFPNKELTDNGATLAAAGLLNAAIVQKPGK